MKRIQHGCWTSALLVVAAITVQSAVVRADEIRVWPTAVVQMDSILLADIADLRGFDPAIQSQLGRLVVHAAPRSGGQVLVRLSDIRGALTDAGANLASIRIFGSSRCKVSRSLPQQPPVAQPPPQKPREAPICPVELESGDRAARPGTLESAVRQFIAARAAMRDARVEIRFSPANVRDLALTDAEYQFEIRARSNRGIGLLSFDVSLVRDGRVERTAPIVAEVSLVKDVVVARRPINRGKTIEGRDLRLEERRFSKIEDIGITELAAAIGQQSRQFVKTGSMLCAKQLQAEPLVTRGQRVTIWSRSGGLVIKTSGKAQQAGALGETIDVRRDGAKRRQDLIEAVITGPGTVTLADTRLAVGH
ncbi:MAG: flagellar basal body P-ring formation chaperone FlgA [Planctomycetota bacterium]